jgi:hypothetical protein
VTRMTLAEERASVFRHAADRQLEDGVSHALDDLSAALFLSSQLVCRLLQRALAHPEIGAEVAAVDEAVGRMTASTRRIAEGLHTRRRSGEYTSASRAVAELGAVLPACLPEDVDLTVQCGEPGATVVAIPRPELLAMVLSLCEKAVGAMPTGGALALDVAGRPVAGKVRIEVRGGRQGPSSCPGVQVAAAAHGGRLEIRSASAKWSAALILPSAC